MLFQPTGRYVVKARIGRWTWLALLATIAAGPSAKITVEVPPEIKAAVEHELGSGRLVGLGPGQDENKNLIYVAHAQIDGWAYTMRFDLDGTLIDTECDEPDPPAQKITPDDLPDNVKEKIKTLSGGAQVTDPTREDYQAIYEVHVTIGGHPYSIRVDGDGKLLSKEREDEDQPTDKKSA
jgi:hypothetical protein